MWRGGGSSSSSGGDEVVVCSYVGSLSPAPVYHLQSIQPSIYLPQRCSSSNGFVIGLWFSYTSGNAVTKPPRRPRTIFPEFQPGVFLMLRVNAVTRSASSVVGVRCTVTSGSNFVISYLLIYFFCQSIANLSFSHLLWFHCGDINPGCTAAFCFLVQKKIDKKKKNTIWIELPLSLFQWDVCMYLYVSIGIKWKRKGKFYKCNLLILRMNVMNI